MVQLEFQILERNSITWLRVATVAAPKSGSSQDKIFNSEEIAMNFCLRPKNLVGLGFVLQPQVLGRYFGYMCGDATVYTLVSKYFLFWQFKESFSM